jgi:magnesium transporter
MIILVILGPQMIPSEGHFDTIANYDFAWTDIQKPTRDHINILGTQYPFHELNLDDCLSKVHIPKRSPLHYT